MLALDPTKYEELKTRAEQLKKELKEFETKYNGKSINIGMNTKTYAFLW